MPPPKEGQPLTPREIDLLSRWIAEGAEYKQHWAWQAPVRPPVPDPSSGRLQPDRCFHPGARASRRPPRLAGGGSPHAAAPRLARSHRPAADAGGGGRVCRRHRAGGLRARGRPAARLAALWREMGAALARSRALCGFDRLWQRRAAAEHLAVPRLGHRGLQSQPAVRPLHHRAARGRPAAAADARSARGDRFSPQHDDEHRGRHHSRRVPRGGGEGPHRDHGASLDGADAAMRAVPHAQVRPDLAARVLPDVRDLQPDRGRRSQGRGADAADAAARGRDRAQSRAGGRGERRRGKARGRAGEERRGAGDLGGRARQGEGAGGDRRHPRGGAGTARRRAEEEAGRASPRARARARHAGQSARRETQRARRVQAARRARDARAAGGQAARDASAHEGKLPRAGGEAGAGVAHGLRAGAGDARADAAGPGAVARLARQSAHRARGGESLLGAALRHGHRGNRGGLRHARRAPVAPGAARLARRHLPLQRRRRAGSRGT